MEKLFYQLAKESGYKVESINLNPKRFLEGAVGKLRGADDLAYWGRLKLHKRDKTNQKLLRGIEDAEVITGISKPRFIKAVEVEYGDALARFEVLTFVPFSPLSTEPWLVHKPILSDAWLQTLRNAVETIQLVPTERIACRDDLVQRRLAAWFPDWDKTYITASCHGDMHWANLTGPNICLFDWEDWGLAPKWYDPALLLVYSGHRDIAARILQLFPELLPGGDGHTALLFAIAELLEMNAKFGDYKNLLPFLNELMLDYKKVKTLV